MIYLDYAATTPMLNEAIEAYAQAAKQCFGNPSSLHDAGGKANMILENARAFLANALGVNKEGIIFTGSGTESNILAILSLARAGKGKHIITSMAEHTSVHAAMNTLQKEGYEITKLAFTKGGVVDLNALKESIRQDTVLISIQHVNSEIGTIQPIEAICELAKPFNIPVHVDCVQSFCKLPIAQFSTKVDAISISAHKIGGPKGCGALYINPRRRVVPVFFGVTHEKGLRGGTVDTPAIVAMITAMENFRYEINHYWGLRNKMKVLLKDSPFTLIEGKQQQQLPSIVGLCMKGVEGQLVMLRMNEKNICVSTGSACDINSGAGTKAILAMGYSEQLARQFFRVSFGIDTNENSIEALCENLIALCEDFVIG